MAGPDETTVDGAAQRIRNLFGDQPQPEEIPVEDNDLTDDVETDYEEAEEVATSDEADFVEETEDDEAGYSRNLEAPPTWTGAAKERFQELDPDLQEEIVRSHRELERGVRKQVDEVAHQRKSLEQERAKAAELSQHLEQALAQMAESEPDLPDESLIDPESDNYDPDRFNREQLRYQRQIREREAKKAELTRAQQQLAADTQVRLAEEMRRNEAVLLNRYPEWGEGDKGVKAIAEVRKYLVEQHGFPPNAVNQIYDAELITIAEKARRYDVIQSGKRPQKQPRTLRPRGKARPKPSTDVSDVLSAHKKSGTVSSAANAIRALRSIDG